MRRSSSSSCRGRVAAVVGPLAIALALLMPAAATAGPPQDFSFQKDCPGAEPYCVIHDASAPFELLDGMAVWYVGPGNPGKMVGDLTYLSYEVTIGPSQDEILATGHFRWLGTKGSWTIRDGTGPLEGLHAEGAMAFVGCDAAGYVCTYELTGRYHIAP
jgi:hypothetical protein